MDQLEIADFDDVELPSPEDVDLNLLELERFQFVNEDLWDEMTRKPVSSAVLKKIKYVVGLFSEWKSQRNKQK